MGKRISLHIEEKVLKDLMRFTGEATATKAIRRAVDELVERERHAAITELRGMLGKVEFDEAWLAQRRREHPGAY